MSILCPRPRALELTAVSGHSPDGGDYGTLPTVPSPLSSMLSLRGWSSQVWQAGGFQSLRLQPPHPGSEPQWQKGPRQMLAGR